MASRCCSRSAAVQRLTEHSEVSPPSLIVAKLCDDYMEQKRRENDTQSTEDNRASTTAAEGTKEPCVTPHSHSKRHGDDTCVRQHSPQVDADLNNLETHHICFDVISAVLPELSVETLRFEQPCTTMMVGNIPCSVSAYEFASIMDSAGFGWTYDLLYLPCMIAATRKVSNLGYGFVNFISETSALCFQQAFEGFSFPDHSSSKVCSVKPARVQGYVATLESAMSGTRSAKKWKRRLSSDSLLLPLQVQN